MITTITFKGKQLISGEDFNREILAILEIQETIIYYSPKRNLIEVKIVISYVIKIAVIWLVLFRK